MNLVANTPNLSGRGYLLEQNTLNGNISFVIELKCFHVLMFWGFLAKRVIKVFSIQGILIRNKIISDAPQLINN